MAHVSDADTQADSVYQHVSLRLAGCLVVCARHLLSREPCATVPSPELRLAHRATNRRRGVLDAPPDPVSIQDGSLRPSVPTSEGRNQNRHGGGVPVGSAAVRSSAARMQSFVRQSGFARRVSASRDIRLRPTPAAPHSAVVERTARRQAATGCLSALPAIAGSISCCRYRSQATGFLTK